MDIPKGRFAVSVIRLDLRSYEALLRKLHKKTTAVNSGVISLEFPGETRDSEIAMVILRLQWTFFSLVTVLTQKSLSQKRLKQSSWDIISPNLPKLTYEIRLWG